MEKYFLLKTEFVFDSAHSLRNYEGKCKNIHGHTWKVEIWIKGDSLKLDETGILFDFTNVQKLKEKLDHKYLNQEIPFFVILNPTAENISLFVYEELKKIRNDLSYGVRIYETLVGKETYCEYGDF